MYIARRFLPSYPLCCLQIVTNRGMLAQKVVISDFAFAPGSIKLLSQRRCQLTFCNSVSASFADASHFWGSDL